MSTILKNSSSVTSDLTYKADARIAGGILHAQLKRPHKGTCSADPVESGMRAAVRKVAG